LAKHSRNTALSHIRDNNARMAFEKELNEFLKNTQTGSTTRTGKEKYYESLIKGGIELNKMVRIEWQENGGRKDNGSNISVYRNGNAHDISSKFADFTLTTINGLIDEGFRDAELAMQKE